MRKCAPYESINHRRNNNHQTAPLLAESFSIIKLQAQADEWIFRYHDGNVRARFELLSVLAGLPS
ncbi:hypothetical protein GKO28_14445 [Deefgea sp. CFH1-16]|nr:hypothetical protein [Deefgea sp. CFH1-16]